MALFGGTNRAATLNYDQKCKSLYVCLSAQKNSGTPLVWHFIEYQRQDVSSENACVRLLRNANLNAVAIWAVTGQGFQNTN